MTADQTPSPAEQTIGQILSSATDAQEVWSATLDVMEGLVAMAVARGWHEHHARVMVCHRFCNGVQ